MKYGMHCASSCIRDMHASANALGKKDFGVVSITIDALQTMIHLNNKYALDGKPQLLLWGLWVLGRFDRA